MALPTSCWSLLSINAMVAADSLIIPLPCEYFAFESLGEQMKCLQMVKNKFNGNIRIGGILLTMYQAQEESCDKILSDIKKHLKNNLFQTVIPRTRNLREFAIYGRPVLFNDITMSNCDVFLVYPYYTYPKKSPPIGLGYIAAVLERAGYSVNPFLSEKVNLQRFFEDSRRLRSHSVKPCDILLVFDLFVMRPQHYISA